MAELSEEEKTDNAVNIGILSAARKILAAGLENLQLLIVDVDSGTVRWPEAWEIFKQHLPLYSEQYPIQENDSEEIKEQKEKKAMMYAIADACEALSDTLTFERLDASIHKAPSRFKILIGSGLWLARMGLKLSPNKAQELTEEGENLVLVMLDNEQTREAHNVLKDRPRLLGFLTRYSFSKLGVNYVAKPIMAEPAIVPTEPDVPRSQDPSLPQ